MLLRGEGLASHQQQDAADTGGVRKYPPLVRGGGEGTGKTKAPRAKWRELGIGEMLMRSAEGARYRRGISVPKEKGKQVLGLKGRQSCGGSFPAAVRH